METKQSEQTEQPDIIPSTSSQQDTEQQSQQSTNVCFMIDTMYLLCLSDPFIFVFFNVIEWSSHLVFNYLAFFVSLSSCDIGFVHSGEKIKILNCYDKNATKYLVIPYSSQFAR